MPEGTEEDGQCADQAIQHGESEPGPSSLDAQSTEQTVEDMTVDESSGPPLDEEACVGPFEGSSVAMCEDDAQSEDFEWYSESEWEEQVSEVEDDGVPCVRPDTDTSLEGEPEAARKANILQDLCAILDAGAPSTKVMTTILPIIKKSPNSSANVKQISEQVCPRSCGTLPLSAECLSAHRSLKIWTLCVQTGDPGTRYCLLIMPSTSFL